MMGRLFTDEELEAMRLADEEIEKEFLMTPEEWAESKARDRQVRIDRLDNRGRKIAAQQAAYYEANREKWNAYQREYRRRKRQLATQNQ